MIPNDAEPDQPAARRDDDRERDLRRGVPRHLFNPLGYAFENYDAIGKYRTTDHGQPVNAADSYTLDGQLKSFTNGVELSQLLAEAKETHACYVQNMMSYLHGRPLARSGARRWSTTTPGCHAPGWSTFTIWSSPS